MSGTLSSLLEHRDEVTLADLFAIRPQWRPCKICYRGLTVEAGMVPLLVSPSGVFHHADNDRTICGHDATGPEWWWAL